MEKLTLDGRIVECECASSCHCKNAESEVARYAAKIAHDDVRGAYNYAFNMRTDCEDWQRIADDWMSLAERHMEQGEYRRAFARIMGTDLRVYDYRECPVCGREL